MSAPTVFISYSHDSTEHADRVLAFANQLRKDGVDCILDQYEMSPPEGWPRWMDQHIRTCDFVAMICTETYFLRVTRLITLVYGSAQASSNLASSFSRPNRSAPVLGSLDSETIGGLDA